MKAIIIEDDISTAISYEIILNECGVSDVSVCSDFGSAREQIIANPPDFAIVDLYLNNELTLDLIPMLNELDTEIVLVTGYPKNEFIEQAVNFDVVSFMPKPVNKHALSFQIHSVAKKKENRINESFCYVKSKNKIVRVPYAKIQMLETEGNYTSIFTSTEKYILKRSLKNVSSELPEEIFTRVHRNYVVNNNNVMYLDMKNNQLEMLDKTIIQIGGKYRNEIKRAIGSKFKVI